jgi:hypothetical protein
MLHECRNRDEPRLPQPHVPLTAHCIRLPRPYRSSWFAGSTHSTSRTCKMIQGCPLSPTAIWALHLVDPLLSTILFGQLRESRYLAIQPFPAFDHHSPGSELRALVLLLNILLSLNKYSLHYTVPTPAAALPKLSAFLECFELLPVSNLIYSLSTSLFS